VRDAAADKRRRHRNERIAAIVAIVLIAVATFWLIRRNEAEEEQLRREQTYVPKPFTRTEDVDLLAEYIRIDTSNPPGRELAGARWFAAQLERGGVRAEIIESAPGRASVYARIRGRQQGTGLLLMHHIDVAPADPAGWTMPPFSGAIKLDALYGRGAIDTKGAAICQLRAFLDVARSGRQPEHDLVILAVADEETGGHYGTQWLLANRRDVFEGVKYVLNEGGITEITAEQMDYFGIEIGTKVLVTAYADAPTREQLQRMRIALGPYYGSRKPQRVLPEVKRFLAELSPNRQMYREALSDVDRAIREGKFWELPSGYRELTQDIVFAEAVRRSGNGWTMRVKMYNLPDTDPDARLTWLKQFAAKHGATLRVEQKNGPDVLSSADTPLFRLLGEEARRSWPSARAGTEILNGAFNDSRYLRKAGMVCYGVQPFPVDFFQSSSIHSVDERVRVAWFQEGVTYMRNVVRRYAFGS
jgi:acetylornithine deacetylase/succinyl-diaminopimelate desuccinylase-like protein